MSDPQFYDLFSAALGETDRDAFVSAWSLPSIWGTAETDEIPDACIKALCELWDVAHMSVREIRDATGLTQAAFALRFCVPRRTVQNWELGQRICPNYLRLLLAQAVGAYKRP